MKRLVLAVAAVAAVTLYADRVNMKSGSVLTGKVLGVQEGVLKVETTDFGAMDIATNLVQSVLTDEKQEPVAVAAVPVLEKPPETWHGSVNVAYQSARGNTYENSATVLANVNRRWDEDRFNANFGYYYTETGTSKQSKDKTVDRWEIEAQWDHFITKSFYGYLNGKYEKDDIAGLDYRFRLGAGLGYQWLEKEDLFGIGKWSFSQEAGAAWIRTEYAVKSPDADDYAASFRYAHHLSYLPVWTEGLEFFHNFEYMPQFNDVDVFLSKADVGFTTKLIFNFDLLAKIDWEYNSTPSVGRKKSDTRYIVGLGYKW
jgi:putative salt-induced outer membrane protein YdiY